MRVSEVDWHGHNQRRLDLPGAFDEAFPPSNDRAVIGNNSGTVIEQHSVVMKLDEASFAMGAMTRFLNDNPVIQDEKAATALKLQIENARSALADLEEERDGKVRPLNDKVALINAAYKAVSEPLKKVMAELRQRGTDYLRALEKERERIAEEARAKVAALEAAAREAERLEREAKENAAAGEFDAGVAEAVVEADAAFGDFKAAHREAARAEREADNVRIGGGAGRSLGLRTQTTLTLTDAIAAIKDMEGLSEKAIAAILSDARAFFKLKRRWPAGVTAEETRGV